MFSKKIAAVVTTLSLVALVSPQVQAAPPLTFRGGAVVLPQVTGLPPRPAVPVTIPQQIAVLDAQGRFVVNVGNAANQVLQGRASVIDAQANTIRAEGEFLKGAATAIDAQGTFLKSVQESRLLHEQVKQAQLETRRSEIDFWLENREKLPTLPDDQERARREQVRLAQNAPPIAEILSGKSLNDLLQDCQILQSKGFTGPAIPLSPASVQHVNVLTAGSSGNAALLRAPGLAWPSLLLQDWFKADRQHVEALVAQVKQKANNAMVADTAQGLHEAVNKLEEEVKALASRSATVTANEVIQARRFLKELRATAQVLRDPNVGGYLDGRLTARGSTAEELVRHMTENRLVFAPAADGNDAGYVAVHRVLASYSIALRAAAGATLADRAGLLSAAQ
jgi:hypothetical protein